MASRDASREESSASDRSVESAEARRRPGPCGGDRSLGVALAAFIIRNFMETTVTVRDAGDIYWHNDDLGPVNTLVIGEGTCEWAPQGLGTFFKTARVTFSDTWAGSQCIIGRQVDGMGECSSPTLSR